MNGMAFGSSDLVSENEVAVSLPRSIDAFGIFQVCSSLPLDLRAVVLSSIILELSLHRFFVGRKRLLALIRLPVESTFSRFRYHGFLPRRP